MHKLSWLVWSSLALLPAGLPAQQKTPLKVLPVAGDGAFNDIRKKTAHDPVVEVRDEFDRRMPNVRVVFQLPMNGAGGAFPGDKKEFIATTDEQGRAVGRGLAPNGIEGRFPIKVTASIDGRQGSGVIWQSNTLAGGSEPRRRGGKGKYIVLGLLGGAAAGVIAATQGGSSSGGAAAAPSTTLSPGAVTVGGPR